MFILLDSNVNENVLLRKQSIQKNVQRIALSLNKFKIQEQYQQGIINIQKNVKSSIYYRLTISQVKLTISESKIFSVLINKMLDYFNTRQQQSFKSPIRRKPQIGFGISIQSPEDFQKPYSLICQNTFVNPYLSYEKRRKNKIPNKKLENINPSWTKKIDINQLETQRTFIRMNNQLTKLSPEDRFKKELSASKARFRLTKGEFTNYLQRNHSNEMFGPLQGKQRNQSKSQLTKKQIAQKSHMKLTQNFDQLTQYRSRLFQSKQPFQQKHLIQKTRFSFRQGFKKQLQERKIKKVDLYALPQILNKSHSNMRYSLMVDPGKAQNPQQTLLSNKSIEKLRDLRDFNYTQRYFTIDGNSKRSRKASSRQKFN